MIRKSQPRFSPGSQAKFRTAWCLELRCRALPLRAEDEELLGFFPLALPVVLVLEVGEEHEDAHLRLHRGERRAPRAGDVADLGNRFGHDTSLFSKLVLGCIDSYDSEKLRIFSHFSKSTRFFHFRTALNAKF